MTLAIVLVIAAAGLLILEITFPTFGLAGVLAATSYAIALYVAFTESGSAGAGIVIAGVIAFPLAFVLALRLVKVAPFTRRNILSAPAEQTLQRGVPQELRSLVGTTGVAATDLRPLGRADLDGARREVIAAGSWIERGTPIRVVEVEGHRIVVDRAPTKES